jgi:hypothetical protein
MLGFGFGSLASLVMLVLGPLTAFNCLRGMFSTEGMYDRESVSTMFWSNLAGVVLGLGLGWLGFARLTGLGDPLGIACAGGG